MPHAGAHGLRPFSVIADNVDGLAKAAKRKPFFAWMQQQGYDVVLLSETHTISAQQMQRWARQGAGPGRPWRGFCYSHSKPRAEGERAGAGVAVLLTHGIVKEGTEPEVEYRDGSGRVLRVAWTTPWEKRVAAVAVYAPADQEQRPAWFDGTYQEGLDAGALGSSLIVGGDFNCALSEEDVQPVAGTLPRHSRRMVGAAQLQRVNQREGLVDAWRYRNPHARQPTHYSFNHNTAGDGAPAAAARGASSSGEAGGQAHNAPAAVHLATSAGRIDYVFLSADLVNGGWVQSATQHRRYPADHRPVVVKLQPPQMPLLGQRGWRYPNSALGDPAFVAEVQDSLKAAVEQQQQQLPRQNPLAELVQLQGHLETATRLVQKRLKLQRQAELRQLRRDVATAYRQHHQMGSSAQTQANILRAEQRLTDYGVQQRQQQGEAGDVLWELYGDGKPSFWGYRLGKELPQPQYISAVAAADGTTISTHTRAGVAAAGDTLADFFDPAAGGLFSQHPTDPQQQQELLAGIDKRLTPEQQQQCLGPNGDGTITLEEAKAALDSLPRGKVPGSDGLTYESYSAFWPQIGPAFVAACNYLFAQEAAQLSPQQRLGLITLLFKGGGKPREQAASYRPITLLNCDVKILAKVVVRRVGPVLDSIIDSTQTAFVPGRDIADNVLLHLEEIDYLQEQQQPGCVTFLDFEKAYDRLDRDWLFKCMSAMQFPAGILQWVQLLLAGTQGRIVFNGGHLSRVFEIPSGCAQGSPLSPLLYVIAAQPLAARCRALQAAGEVNSIRLPDGSASPCCMQHADDTSLHAASRQGTGVLFEKAVRPFCAASGAKVNTAKCQGMEVGVQQPFVGVDTATTIPFPDTAQNPIRHLGIPMSAQGAQPHAAALYTQRLQTVTWRVRQWARQDLTYLGRCAVAKQVLASCLTYHTQFVPVPEDIMDRLHRRLTAFVMGQGCVREAHMRRWNDSPPEAVASLAVSMGGCGQVDVRAHAAAMQARTAAALLHPRRTAWKPLMRANLRHALPGLGEAVLVQQSKGPLQAAVRVGRLQQRHAAYVEGFQRVGIHRHMAHDSMSSQQIGLELLVGNHSVGSSTDGNMLPAAGSLPSHLNQGPGTSVGQVLQVLTWQPARDGVVLPPAWQHTLQEGSTCAWQVDATRQWVQQETEQGTKTYGVQQDGSLEAADSALAGAQSLQWVPCCVVDVTQILHPSFQLQQQQRQQQQQQQGTGEQQREALSGSQQQQPLLQQGVSEEQVQQQQRQAQRARPPSRSPIFLVGAWQNIKVDPSVWGLGFDMGVLQFTPKAATQRLLQHHCGQHHGEGWVPGVGKRPRLWRDRQGAEAPQDGLQDMETALKRSFQEMLDSNMQGSGRRSSSATRRFSDAALMEAYHAPWMDPPRERELPRQRAAAAAAVTTIQRQQQLQQQLQIRSPARDDLLDPVTEHMGPVDASSHKWVAAYQRAGHKQLPRSLRVFGWRLLHAGVKVGARRMVVSGRREPAQFTCPAQQCQQQPQLETLTHLFVECPVAATVWQWFAQLWQQVQPGAMVPVSSSRALLLDDDSVWAPPLEKQQLWTYMRLLLLESIWVVRSRCSTSQPGGSQSSSSNSHSNSNGGSTQGNSGGSGGEGSSVGRGDAPAATAGNARFTAKAVACRFRAELQQQMQRDWKRVGVDVRLGSGVPMAWLRGPSPVLTLSKFWWKWGAIFTVEENGDVAVAVSTAGL
jgi:exonuclease III